MSESAWKWGGYRRGYGKGEFDDPRIKYAVLGIKKELKFLSYAGFDATSPIYGLGCERAVKKFQRHYGSGLVVDGIVGSRTANALWHKRIAELAIPGDWLRAQVHWESGDDPGAAFANPDGSVDRGLCQINSTRKPLTEQEAYDPMLAIEYLGTFLAQGAQKYADCAFEDEWKLAVGRWRTPVGADAWCINPDTEPNQDGTWAQQAAYYVGRVDTDGRSNWVG